MERTEKNKNKLWPIVGEIWRRATSSERDRSEWLRIWGQDGDRYLAMTKWERERLAKSSEKF
jgi:hypothetical protein